MKMHKIQLFSTVILLSYLLFLSSAIFADLQVPKLTGRVVDNAHLLSSNDETKITNAIKKFENGTGGQMAVLTIPSLNGEVLEEFSIKVADKWKIGYKGKDNGLILLIAKKERKIRLEVSSDWEGVINDARAGDIIRGMKSYFKSKQFKDGILFAISKAHKYITGKKLGISVTHPRKNFKESLKGYFLFIIIIIFVIMSFFFRTASYTYAGRGYRTRRRFWIGGGGFGGSGFGGGGGFSGGGGGFSGGGASGGW